MSKETPMFEKIEIEPPRNSPISDPVMLAKIAEFMRRAPAPRVDERGDPADSAAEDQEIMDELAPLRREANRELD
jgi:hypothetical protein